MGEHILVINGSHRGRQGSTGMVVERFLQGCHEMGASSEIIEVANTELKFCAGELACYFKPDHLSCRVHKSDQGTAFIEKWIHADRILLASPLHLNNVSSHLKRFLERLICMSSPYYIENDGYPTHEVPYAPKPSVVIGVCAHPGIDNFFLFREVMLNYQKVFWLEGGGYVLVPRAQDLLTLDAASPHYRALQEVAAAITQAGREFMLHNEITLATEDAICRDMDDTLSLQADFKSRSTHSDVTVGMR